MTMQLTVWEKVAFALCLLLVVSGMLSVGFELATGYKAPGDPSNQAARAITVGRPAR